MFICYVSLKVKFICVYLIKHISYYEMDLIDESIIIAAATTLCCYLLVHKPFKQRVYKTRPINRNRKTHGFFQTYFIPMKIKDEQQFFKYTRLSVCSFKKLLDMVNPHLQKRKLPDSISSEERLAITLQ